MKQCKCCGETKCLSDFVKESRMADGTRNKCKACKNIHRRDSAATRARELRLTNPNKLIAERAACQRWHVANRDVALRRMWKDSLRRRYGMTPEQFSELSRAQDGKCAICRKDADSPRGLVVDHSHATGEIRGLLCRHCNWGLGHFHDCPRRLMDAFAYLSRGVREVAS